MASARFAEILRLLAENEVEFVVVGMTAGVKDLAVIPALRATLDELNRRAWGDRGPLS